MAQEEKEKIIRHPKRLPVTFVGIVFGLILVYLVVQGILFLVRDRNQAYNIGAADSDRAAGTFHGMILRDEICVGSEGSGYLSYYASGGDRLKAGTLVLTTDENGGLEERLHLLYSGKDVLDRDSLRRIREAITDADSQYDPVNFESALFVQTSVRAAVLNRLLEKGQKSVENILPEGSYTEQRTSESGFFLLWEDGYEGKTVQDLRASDFDPENYTGYRLHTSGETVKTGDFVYKLASDNKFTIVFLLSETDIDRLQNRKNLSIRLSDGTELRGAFSIRELQDRKSAGVLEFQKYGGNYLSSRFLDFQILDTEITGFKIPETAIVRKNFFVVDRAYITTGGNTNQNGLLVETESGAEFVPATVYLRNEDEDSFIIGDENTAYVFSSELQAGMTIINMEETGHQSRSTLGVTTSVEGVYQINQGYCIFKPILRIANSLDTAYTVIKSDMRYGLQAYDRILLDGSAVGENDFIYE